MKGEEGDVGEPGLTGAKGEPGETGLPGIPGADGLPVRCFIIVKRPKSNTNVAW